MPHVIIKLFSGRSDQQKARLAEEVCNAVTGALGCDEKSVSVGIEDVGSAEWTEKVYRPDILGKKDKIYKQPGYDPF